MAQVDSENGTPMPVVAPTRRDSFPVLQALPPVAPSWGLATPVARAADDPVYALIETHRR
jgi:hypothetical protein